jgi:membrane fusion protein (multidrug efflux system)
MRLPASAINSENSVLVLGPKNRLEAVQVILMRRQGDDVLVRSADLIGREVVEARSPLLGVGIAVRPLRSKEPIAAPNEPEMLELSAERRAKLVAFIEGNQRMPTEAKARVLARLNEPRVPARMVARLEERMGG